MEFINILRRSRWKLRPNWQSYGVFILILVCPFISYQARLSYHPQIKLPRLALDMPLFTLDNPPAEAATAPTAASVPAPITTEATAPPSGPVASPTPSLANYYPYGQCTYYVASRRQIPPHWGNAANWYYAAQAAGWGTGPTPAVGAIAWTPAGWVGHVAYVEQVTSTQVLISEMNYAGNWGVRTERWVAPSDFSYIY